MAAALEAAYKQVEAGKLEDHPKQAALQKALIGIQTVQPVGIPFNYCMTCLGSHHTSAGCSQSECAC